MPTTLQRATLTDAERRTLTRVVAAARAEFGDRLREVWLFGSRARGERAHDESDLDVLVIADDPRVRSPLALDIDLAEEAATAEGVNPAALDILMRTPQWLEQRRSIDSFFLREVDRDRIDLLAGRAVSPRSEEFLAQARERLAALDEIDVAAHPQVAVSIAYYAMLYVARALLSERDELARTHQGTWLRMRETIVADGTFPAELLVFAQRTQRLREGGDYDAMTMEPADARAVVTGARRFVEAAARI